MKTRLDKALNNFYSDNSTNTNINEAIKLANNLEIVDILDPSSKIVGELAEIVNRLQNSDELEIVDMDEFIGGIHTYS
jgi:uncharacterized membrane-anchored protein YjiN (DUF445 family)